MKIIIVGVGKVGSTLCDFLSNENHDVVIVDTNAKIVEETINKYDVSGVVGSGTNIEVLLEAGVKGADMIIATTEFDELNILTCLIGKQQGVRHTIARVRNPEYSTQTKFMSEDLKLDLIINPELEAANEISRVLRFPSAESVELFAKNRIEIVGFKLPKNSKMVNSSLEEIRKQTKTNFLIVAVERKQKAIIPTGKFKLEENDIIYVTGAKGDILNLAKEMGIYKDRAKKIMIIGGSVITYYLAKQLIRTNTNVKIVEMDRDRCVELKQLLPQATIIQGDGTDKDLLIEEGINDVDAFVTLTGLDEENIILSLFAKNEGVHKVITKINNLSYYNILASLNLSSIISPKLITAYNILRYIRSLQNAIELSVENIYKLINNQVEAVEFLVKNDNDITNIPIKELNLKPDILIAVIIRGTNIIFPSGDDMILPNDRVIIISTNQNIANLEILQ